MIGHRDRNPGFGKIDRCRVGRVVVGDDDRTLCRHHREAVGIAPQRRGQHDARPVVVGEDQRPLDRTGGHDDGLEAQRRQHLTRFALAGVGPAVIAAFHKNGEVAVIKALHRGPRQQLRLIERLEFGHAGLQPGLGAASVSDEKAAAELEILLRQHDAGAAARSRERCRKTGGA